MHITNIGIGHSSVPGFPFILAAFREKCHHPARPHQKKAAGDLQDGGKSHNEKEEKTE
jgi:hypothetical protein